MISFDDVAMWIQETCPSSTYLVTGGRIAGQFDVRLDKVSYAELQALKDRIHRDLPLTHFVSIVVGPFDV